MSEEDKDSGTKEKGSLGKDRRFWYLLVWIFGGMIVLTLMFFEHWRRFEQISAKQIFFTQPELLWSQGDSIVLLNRDGLQPRLMSLALPTEGDTTLTPVTIPNSRSVSPSCIAATEEKDYIATIEHEGTSAYLTVWANYHPGFGARNLLKFPMSLSADIKIIDLLWLNAAPDWTERRLLLFCNQAGKPQLLSLHVSRKSEISEEVSSPGSSPGNVAPSSNTLFLKPFGKDADQGDVAAVALSPIEIDLPKQQWTSTEFNNNEAGLPSTSHPVARPFESSSQFLAATEQDTAKHLYLFDIQTDSAGKEKAVPHEVSDNQHRGKIISWNWSADGRYILSNFTSPEKPKSRLKQANNVFDKNWDIYYHQVTPLDSKSSQIECGETRATADVSKYPCSFEVGNETSNATKGDETSGEGKGDKTFNAGKRTFVLFLTRMRKFGYNLWMQPLDNPSDAINAAHNASIEKERKVQHQMTAQLDIVGRPVCCYHRGKLYVGVINRESTFLGDEKPKYRVIIVVVAQNDLNVLYPHLIGKREHDQ